MAPTPHICGSVSSELKDSPDNLIWHRRSWWSSKLVSAHLPNNNKREFPSERTGTTGLSPTRVSLDAEGLRLLIMSLSHSCLNLPTCCSTLRQDFDHDCHHDVPAQIPQPWIWMDLRVASGSVNVSPQGPDGKISLSSQKRL